MIALLDSADRYHSEATLFYKAQQSLKWYALNETSHEAYTRIRYRGEAVSTALSYVDFLWAPSVQQVEFGRSDEESARDILGRYSDHRLSFHDALCAAVMKRIGIVKVFSFDRDFWTLGFQMLPGPY